MDCFCIQVGRLQAFDFPGCLQMLQNYAENLEQYPFIQYLPVHALPEAHDVKIVKEPLGGSIPDT